MLLDLPRDVIRSVAHFRLRAHTLQIETVTWTHNTSPTSFRKKLNDSAFTKNTRSITTAPNLTALTNKNLRLKVPDRRLWAYTDGSCLTYKSQQRVGAGVFIPATKSAIYVNPGGVGISNPINRAEMTGIAFALRAKCTHIATDNACSLSQIRKQLLFPELHRKHTHCKHLEQIVSIRNNLGSNLGAGRTIK